MHILIFETHAPLRQALAHTLEQRSITVMSLAAPSHYTQNDMRRWTDGIDLVICDQEILVTDIVRSASERSSALPIILTCRAGRLEEQQATRTNIAYLAKPFALSEMIQLIETYTKT